MTESQATRRASLGSRYPAQVAVVRVGVGIWLLALTAILRSSVGAGWWVWILPAVAALHFALAYRLVRIAGAAPRAGARLR